jgi:hypothetical protein
MTLQAKKDIIDKSKDLRQDEYLQLFRIIKEGNVVFSENKNGVLVNLEKVPISIIKKLKEIIDLCHSNRKANIERNELIEQAKRRVNEHYGNKIQRVFKEAEEDNIDAMSQRGNDEERSEIDEEVEVYESD